MDPASASYLQAVARELSASFSDPSKLLGVYLHGSAVLGGFNQKTSDIDIIAVCKEPMAVAEKDAVVTHLSRTNLPCPAGGLEMSIVTLNTIRHPIAECPYELHITTIPGDSKVVDGEGQPGDPDLVLHFAVCRQSGLHIGDFTQPFSELCPPIDKDLVLAQVKREVYWGLKLHPKGFGEYAVLNTCRAWKFHCDGRLVSKIEGGDWVLDNQTLTDEERKVVEGALQWHKSGAEVKVDQSVAKEFGRRVMEVFKRPTSWDVEI